MPVILAKPVLDAGIVTKDMESAHRFYGTTLGLTVAGEIDIPSYGLVRRYTVGDSTLRIYLPTKEPNSEGSRNGFATQTGIRYLTLYVCNLDDATDAVKNAGFKIAVAVRELRPGVRVSQVEDADGNTVELMETI
ncbi:VOC family protein [Zhongshania aquimaris]|uniref:VOC family protein n=1 Tax=Zhongshania aquimaris TaxID=2857107 RepID=A0ABS6VNQ9_9GAMM|nr:VOC family protein [Zhongshania aquimaris]MBW2939906.1 VOC family protein [Zhongshania aquimaris]